MEDQAGQLQRLVNQFTVSEGDSSSESHSGDQGLNRVRDLATAPTSSQGQQHRPSPSRKAPPIITAGGSSDEWEEF